MCAKFGKAGAFSDNGAERPSASVDTGRVKSWIPWLFLGLAAGCSASESTGRANVLCVVIDSLRADEVSPDRTPAFDALARTGARFDRAYASSSWNMPAVASMLTGLGPRGHGVVRINDALGPEHETLATAFADAGYATSAVVSDFRLGRARGFDRGFEVFDDDAAGGNEVATTAAVIAKASQELERLSRAERPFFLFVHLYDPHSTYLDRAELDWADPTGTSLRGGESVEELRWIGNAVTEVEGQFIRDLHAEEVWVADRGLQALLDQLDATGCDDETTVVAVGSHGQELFDRGNVGSATSLYEEQIHVPLVIRVPDGGYRRVTEVVSTTSLAATLLQATGHEVIGRAPSLVDHVHGRQRTREPIIVEIDYEAPVAQDAAGVLLLRAIVETRFKLIHDALAQTTELYDLQADPYEARDVARSFPFEVKRLQSELESRVGPLVLKR